MFQPTLKRTRDRVEPTRPTPVYILGAAKAGSVLTITFNQAVRLNGVPQYDANVANVDPVSAVMTSPNVMALTYSAAVTAVTLLTIPFEEAAVRSSNGGFVANSTFPVA